MSHEIAVQAGSLGPAVTPHQEVPMVRQERWEEIRRSSSRERVPVVEIARGRDLDRKAGRRCLRAAEWTPHRAAPRSDSLRARHADYLREWAPPVSYSAQILFQVLRPAGGGARPVCAPGCPASASARAPVAMSPTRQAGRSSARIPRRAMVSGAPQPAGRCSLTAPTESGRIATPCEGPSPPCGKARFGPGGTRPWLKTDLLLLILRMRSSGPAARV